MWDQLEEFKSMKSVIGFCVFGLLAALVVTPLVGAKIDRLASVKDIGSLPGIDRTVTGSIVVPRVERPVRGYTIRRSVLNPNPSEACYIYDDGSRTGSCQAN